MLGGKEGWMGWSGVLGGVVMGYWCVVGSVD